ncbi:hypothetical protein ASE09_33560 [Streptomyces sp. Root66D1]|nr:hypothetical protein ASE09_33560 [Streptomyces sp. Root66D1]
MGEAVGPLVQFAVGEGRVVVDDGERVRGQRGLPLEEAVDGGVVEVADGGVVEVVQDLGLFGRGEELDVAGGAVGVVADVGEGGEEVAGQGCRRRGGRGGRRRRRGR